jgi:hypothetical protein
MTFARLGAYWSREGCAKRIASENVSSLFNRGMYTETFGARNSKFLVRVHRRSTESGTACVLCIAMFA